MRYITLSAFSLGVLIGFSAFCSSVEVGMYVPWSAVQSSLSSTEKHKLIGSFQNVEVSSEFGAIQVPLIETQANFTLKVQKMLNLSTKLSSDDLQLQIRIPAFNISKQVVKQVGSAQIIVNLNARCDDIVLRNSGLAVEADLNWQAQSDRIHAQVNLSQLDWAQNSWQIQTFSCQGPIGFADLLQTQIASQLHSAFAFRAPLQNYLEKYLNEYFQQSLDAAMTPSLVTLPNSKYSYRLHRLESLDEAGLKFVLRLQDESGPESAPKQKFNFADYKDLASRESAQLLIPASSYSEIVKAILEKESLKTRLNSIAGFASLLRSRFFQFFVWPDLMKWPKSSVFDMLSKANLISDLKYDSRAKQFSAAFQLSSSVYAEKDAKLWRYLDFKNSLLVKFDMDIAGGQLVLKPTQSKMNSVYSFGPEYKQVYHPRGYIAASMITEAARKEFFEKSLSLSLPKMNLGGKFVFEASQLSKDHVGNLLIHFSRQKE